MKNLLVIFCIAIGLALTNCRKPVDIPEEVISNVDNTFQCDYTFTTDVFDQEQYDDSLSWPLPPAIIWDYYSYFDPVFNPNNPCEVAYVRANNIFPTLEHEIWVMDLESGNASMVANNYRSTLNWGSNGWLIYTGTNLNVFKIKSNGDSLTQLSSEGGKEAGKWNPSGTMYWIINFNTPTSFHSSNGAFLFEQSTLRTPLDWINDSTVLVIINEKLHAKSFPSETLTLLHSKEIFGYNLVEYILDRENMDCYTYVSVEDTLAYFSRLDLSGTNAIDTILPWYTSYYYLDRDHNTSGGDFANGKLITPLVRTAIPNPDVGEISKRINIVMMNPDGSEERMLLLP